MLNELLTIVIISHDSAHHLERNLLFLNNFTSKVRVLILDSGKINSETYLKSLSLQNLVCEYRYYPHSTSFENKFSDGIQHIQTEFSVISGADDFLLEKGLSECVNFLKSNPEYSACHGSYVSFSADEKNQVFFHNLEKPLSFEQSSVKERLFKCSENYFHNFYSVQRTESFRYSYTESSKNVDDHIFRELLPAMIVLTQGKIKGFNYLFCLREVPLLKVKPDYRKDVSLYTFQADGILQNKISRFVEALSWAITKFNNFPAEDSEKLALETFQIYADKNYPGLLNYREDTFLAMKRLLKKKFTRLLKYKRNIFGYFSKDEQRLKLIISKLKIVDSSYDIELEKAKNFIAKFDAIHR